LKFEVCNNIFICLYYRHKLCYTTTFTGSSVQSDFVLHVIHTDGRGRETERQRQRGRDREADREAETERQTERAGAVFVLFLHVY